MTLYRGRGQRLLRDRRDTAKEKLVEPEAAADGRRGERWTDGLRALRVDCPRTVEGNRARRIRLGQLVGRLETLP